MSVNLAVIPNDFGNYDPSNWSAYGADPQINFLDPTVFRTPGHPSIWHRYPHTSADVNGARETDGRWYPCKAGDHIIFKCWEKTGPADNPAYNNDTHHGSRIGIDFCAPDPSRPGYIMIVAGALVNGVGYDDISIAGHYASEGSNVPCNTPDWTQQIIDCIVPSGFNITEFVDWLQMRPEQGDSAQGWFADSELYLNPPFQPKVLDFPFPKPHQVGAPVQLKLTRI